MMGLSREAAAAFSFLIAIPVIAGAATMEVGLPLLKAVMTGQPVMKVVHAMSGGYTPLALLWGGLVSFGVGWVSLRWLIQIIVRRGLNGFVYYVLTASALTFLWQGYEFLARKS
jgi:undecaprenyl pyrophosphate phosphatase UppP